MTHQSDAVDVRAYEIHQTREAAFEQWWQATSHMTKPESREALARMAYHAALAARQDGGEASEVVKPIQEVFHLPEGTVTITFPNRLSMESYQDLEDQLSLILRRVKRRAGKDEEAAN